MRRLIAVLASLSALALAAPAMAGTAQLDPTSRNHVKVPVSCRGHGPVGFAERSSLQAGVNRSFVKIPAPRLGPFNEEGTVRSSVVTYKRLKPSVRFCAGFTRASIDTGGVGPGSIRWLTPRWFKVSARGGSFTPQERHGYSVRLYFYLKK